MPLLTNFVRKKNAPSQNPFENPLNELFFAREHSADFPFSMALETYKSLIKNTQSDEEAMLFLLEDIIYTSIYATFYETLLVTCAENPEHMQNLIRSFQAEADMRENLINDIAAAHFKYIIHHGHCKGCNYCGDHSEVDELCEYWNAQDEKFFKTMYIGMMTIQFTMEHLIYDIIPTRPRTLSECNENNVLKFRKTIYQYVEQKLQLN